MADFSWLYHWTAPSRPCPHCGYLMRIQEKPSNLGRCRGCVEDDERDLPPPLTELLRILRGAA